MKEFKNKVAAITGSATGIGRAFAEEAAKRGMRLALIDINTEGLEETKAICEKAGAPKVVTIKTDVTKYEEVRFSILRVMQEYGQLDLMFANAGIATAGWVYNHPPQDWAWAMNTNVLGLTYYVHEVLPIFKQQGTPCHFLFTASIAGLITGLRYNTAYLASKHAAVCIAEAVRDLAENDPDYSMMGVSVFCPEYVHTNIHNSEDHRPADYSVPCDPFYATDSYWDYRRLFDSNITVKGMNPAFVGPYLFEAVEENHMYKVPHMHTHEQIRARHRRIESDLERRTAVGAAAAVQIERQQIRRHAAGDRVHVDPSIRSMILFLARKYVTFAHDSDLPKMSAMSRKLSSPSVRSKNTSLYCAPSSCTWR